MRCGALRNNVNASSFESIKVEVLMRLSLRYFDVNLILLCFYNSPLAQETFILKEMGGKRSQS